jgi:tetratricopeptide (TPR) repeat protein/tRNA A-37 threonylcarbamoyl transferase component Bud32
MSMIDLVGQTINGRYRIETLIGKGGMATVYKAFDLLLKRDVAVKFPHSLFQRDPVFANTFRQEMEAVAKLRHPHIVAVYDAGQHNGLSYLVMEFVPSGSMDAFLRPGEPFAPAHVAGVVGQLAEGLDHAHAHGLVHRDVKPSNVLIEADGTVKLTDFGIVKAINDAETNGIVMGTPAYMAPEHLLGEQAAPSNDIYALGVIAYELLTGHKPFDGDEITIRGGHLSRQPPPIRSLNTTISPRVEQAVLYALNKSPEQRYRTAKAFGMALRDAVSPPKPPLIVYQPWMRPVGAVLGVLLLLVIILSGVLYSRVSQFDQSVASAEADFVAGRIDDAIVGFEGVLQSDPQRLDAANRLTLLYNLRDRYPAAEGLARETIGRNPASVEAHAWLAWALHNQYQFDEALAAADEAIALDPQHPLGHAMRALVNGELAGRTSDRELLDAAAADAKTAIDRATQLAAQPGGRPLTDVKLFEALAYNARGMVYWNQYQLESDPAKFEAAVTSGVNMYNRAISAKPQLALFHANLGYFFFFQGRNELAQNRRQAAEAAFENARSAFEDALAVDDNDLRSRAGIGWIHNEREEYEQALEVFERSLPTDQGVLSITGYEGLNSVYRNMSPPDYDEAIRAAERGLDLIPQSDWMTASLAWTYLEQEQYEEAERQFQAVLDLNPGSIDARLGLSRVYRWQSEPDVEQALTQIEEALAIDPQHVSALIYLGETYQEQGRAAEAGSDEEQRAYEQAEAAFQKALEINSRNSYALGAYAWVLYDVERYDEASSQFERAIALDPEYAGAYNGLGWTSFEQERYEAAEQSFAQAIELGNEYVNAMYGRARSLQELNRIDEAITQIKAAIEIAPDNENYTALLRELEGA